MSQAETNDFIKYVNNFLKMPITPKQNAAIVCLMLNGTINHEGAKGLLKYIIKQNLDKHNEIMAMSKEQILQLIDNRIAA
jgi:GH24 family phage-related lysozyme (muramidase)